MIFDETGLTVSITELPAKPISSRVRPIYATVLQKFPALTDHNAVKISCPNHATALILRRNLTIFFCGKRTRQELNGLHASFRVIENDVYVFKNEKQQKSLNTPKNGWGQK